jgi:hypothetical protein
MESRFRRFTVLAVTAHGGPDINTQIEFMYYKKAAHTRKPGDGRTFLIDIECAASIRMGGREGKERKAQWQLELPRNRPHSYQCATVNRCTFSPFRPLSVVGSPLIECRLSPGRAV